MSEQHEATKPEIIAGDRDLFEATLREHLEQSLTGVEELLFKKRPDGPAKGVTFPDSKAVIDAAMNVAMLQWDKEDIKSRITPAQIEIAKRGSKEAIRAALKDEHGHLGASELASATRIFSNRIAAEVAVVRRDFLGEGLAQG